MPRSTAQITGCSIGGVAERAVVGDDAQAVVVALGVGGEAVGGEGVGHGVQRGAERLGAVRRSTPLAPMAAAMARPYCWPDLLGHRLGRVVGQQRTGPCRAG